MRVAVVTPVGPGHQKVILECNASVEAAWRYSRGPFDGITHAVWDDTRGELGRSKARNLIVAASDADWYFFIDADDLCDPHAFQRFGEAISSDPDLAAVFGAICTDRNGVLDENIYPLDWSGLLQHGPCHTIAMGCFVRGGAAHNVIFNEMMDAGEDFDFYLRLLHGRRWTKLNKPLVTIRTFVPSAIGPRGYTSLDWRAECQAVIDRWKTAHPTVH